MDKRMGKRRTHGMYLIESRNTRSLLNRCVFDAQATEGKREKSFNPRFAG